MMPESSNAGLSTKSKVPTKTKSKEVNHASNSNLPAKFKRTKYSKSKGEDPPFEKEGPVGEGITKFEVDLQN